MTVEGATTNVAEKATQAAEIVITELVDNTNMAYIIAAIVIGAVIGVGIVLMMDDANQKNVNRIADDVQDVFDSNAPVIE